MSLPELFGSYVLHHQIARGTTSDVFLAQTVGDFPRVCAVKCIRPEVAALPSFLEHFRDDAALLVRLIHGNLVQVLEVGAVEDRLFVAMEQVDGIDLRVLVSRADADGPLPPELAIYVAIELCEAASYIRMHRRERGPRTSETSTAPWPFEVMLAFDGVVKLVDLGSFGSIYLGQQQIGRVLDNPGYSVPEVLLKQPLTAQSDLFAIGLWTWEMLWGKRLVASDPESYVREVLAGTFHAPQLKRLDVPGDVIRLVDSMLNLQPDKRPRGIEAARDRLVEALRRMAPSYGSAALSQFLWRRCQSDIFRAQGLINEVVQRAPTERDLSGVVATQSFSRAGAVARRMGAPTTLKPGDPIPGTRYRVVRKVGEGGSAEVFAAQHVDLDRKVALKILSSELAGNAEAIAHFRLEARACSRVGHPNIVDVIDFGELDDGRFFFAMELVDGHSLADVIENGDALAPERAIGIFRQIAKALAATHLHGIVHRDLKPENIMLVERDGRSDFVKLLDFGVMAFGADTTTEAVGTPGYMAPEQVRGESPAPSMDVYAVGATLFEVLAGEPAFPCETFIEFVRLQKNGPAPLLSASKRGSELHPGFSRLVARAMHSDPSQRHASMTAFETDLLAVQHEAGLKTPWDDLPPPGQLTGSARREPPVAAGEGRRSRRAVPAALVFALLLAVLAVAVIQYRAGTRNGAVTTTVPAEAPRPTGPAPGPGPLAPEIQQLLARAERAAANGQFTQPADANALDILTAVEARAPGRPETGAMRHSIAQHLEGAGDRLRKAELLHAARTLYREALLFEPGSTRLLRLAYAGEGPAGPRAASKPNRPPAELTVVAWYLSQVQLAVSEGRYLRPANNNALHFLEQLRRMDPSGHRTAEAQRSMARTLRAHADTLWTQGDQAKARSVYQLVAALDASDHLAEVRAAEPPPPAVPSRRAEKPARPAAKKHRDESAIAQDDRRKAEQLVTEGKRALDGGHLSEAHKQFQAALLANPNEQRAVVGLANVAFERAHYPQVVEFATRAIGMNSKAVQVHLLLGDAYFKLYRLKDAIRSWENVLTLDPGNARASARIRRAREKLKEAE